MPDRPHATQAKRRAQGNNRAPHGSRAFHDVSGHTTSRTGFSRFPGRVLILPAEMADKVGAHRCNRATAARDLGWGQRDSAARVRVTMRWVKPRIRCRRGAPGMAKRLMQRTMPSQSSGEWASLRADRKESPAMAPRTWAFRMASELKVGYPCTRESCSPLGVRTARGARGVDVGCGDGRGVERGPRALLVAVCNSRVTLLRAEPLTEEEALASTVGRSSGGGVGRREAGGDEHSSAGRLRCERRSVSRRSACSSFDRKSGSPRSTSSYSGLARGPTEEV